MSNKEQNDIKQYSGKSILYLAIMRHKKGFLICVLLALLSSTFAWFYGSLTASVQANVDVESWSVKIGDDEGETKKVFTFPEVYPGVKYLHENPTDALPAGKYIIPVENTGETPAYLTLEIQNLYLFGEKLIKYKEQNHMADPQNYVADFKVNSEKITDVATGRITSAKYFIEGMPFNLTVNFPKTILNPNEKTQIEFDLIWDYRGDITSTKVKRKDDLGNLVEVMEPKCSAQITSPPVLEYIENQKNKYSAAGIEINDTTIVEDKDGQVNISTCDIIDTYFGEKAKAFDNEKTSLGITDEDEFYYNGADTEKHPTKDLYIELAITASQTTIDTPTT